MKEIEDNFNQNHNVHMNHTDEMSDNTSKLNQFIFFRVEYKQDSHKKTQSVVKPITKHNTWSNYGNMGKLKLYEKK